MIEPFLLGRSPRAMRKFLIAALIACSSVGVAKWAMIDREVPVDQILPTLERQVREHPRDAQARFLLGRIHSMAFASEKRMVPVVREDHRGDGELIASYHSVRVRRTAPPRSRRNG